MIDGEIVKDFLGAIDISDGDKEVQSGKNVTTLSKLIRRAFTDLLKPFIDMYGQDFGDPIPDSTYYQLPDGTRFISELETTQALYIDITNLQREISKIPDFSKPCLRVKSTSIEADEAKLGRENLTRITEYEIVSICFLAGLDIKKGANLAGALKMVLNAVRIIAEKYDIDEAIALSDERLLQIGGLHQEPNTTGSLPKSKEFMDALVKTIQSSPNFANFVASDDDKYDLKWDAIFKDRLKKEKPNYYAKHTQYNKFKKQALADGKNELEAAKFAKEELKKWIDDPKGYQKAMDRLASHNARKADVDNSDDE